MISSEIRTTIVFILLIHTFTAQADSFDSNYEKLISSVIVEKTADEELYWIDTISSTFLSLFKTNNDKRNKRAIIILHSLGSHADWPYIVSPLRNKLPNYNLPTLSIQLPVISPEKNIEDYGNVFQENNIRINAAINFLKKKGYQEIILIGHGFGALSSLVYIEKEKINSIDGVVLISLQNYAYIKPPINVLRLIEKIKIPILDIYGSLDFKESIDIAPDRRLASKKSGNSQYYQVEINGADHYFNNMEDNLIDHIINWTDNLL